MPSTSPPLSATAASTPREQLSRRPLWFDRLVIAALGASGSVLSFNALRQVAVAIHTAPALSFLFPVVIDGFIAYGVRAILVLRDAPLGARLYAWTLFGAATAASLWANALHSVRLNRPGVHILILGNHTVAILSAIAPLALGGATHLHILVTRNAARRPAPAGMAHQAAGMPTMIPADTPMIPAATPAKPVADTDPIAARDEAADGQHNPQQSPANANSAGHSSKDEAGQRRGTARAGRRAEASIEQLADIIAQAHPDNGQLTRAMARNAIEAHGLSAANGRISQALKQLQPDEEPQPHPPIA